MQLLLFALKWLGVYLAIGFVVWFVSAACQKTEEASKDIEELLAIPLWPLYIFILVLEGLRPLRELVVGLPWKVRVMLTPKQQIAKALDENYGKGR